LILVDANVILDLVENDPVWADWSQHQLERASLQTTLCINPVIYAELSIFLSNNLSGSIPTPASRFISCSNRIQE
jgi:predicted nucleic acid-binding protein